MKEISEKTKVIIDGMQAMKEPNRVFDGFGFISANNSSRLLLDYKACNEDAYWEIMNYVFGEDGLGITLFKLEMGSDVDSSSGTEPAVKRSISEKADVTRGAGYVLAADALKINPDLQIDMLNWGIPKWVADGENPYEALYCWYKETIEAMYDTYGLKLTYLTVCRNEKEFDLESIKYVVKALKEEKDSRYDYSSIKIVAGEGVTDWKISEGMLEDKELLDAVDIVSSHYTSLTDDNTKKLINEYGKKAWFSEGSSPMKSERLAARHEGSAGALGGINGMLDIASRITHGIYEGMTMYEFQPVVSAYYDGATYYPKQLITANEPWSGAYSLDAGYYMGLHFGRFFKKGACFIKGACFGDGVPGGDGHALVDSKFNYAACTDSDLTDYSMVIVNNTGKRLLYEIEVINIKNPLSPVTVIETAGTDSYFVTKEVINPEKAGEGAVYTIVMEPFSLVTLSTLTLCEKNYKDRRDMSRILNLPYSDDYKYSSFGKTFLAERGMAPLYTTDQGGAFEVEERPEGNVLMQKINSRIIPVDWGGTSEPVTTFGDDRWHNYTVSVQVNFTEDRESGECPDFVGVGARYILADINQSGYWLKLFDDGRVMLMKDNDILSGTYVIGDFDRTISHTIAVTVIDDMIFGSVDRKPVLKYRDAEHTIFSGRAAYYSSFANNFFANPVITPESGNYAITRLDDMSKELSFSAGSCKEDGEGWYFNTLSGFKNFNRTLSTGHKDDTVSFTTEGSAFAVIGPVTEASIRVEVDKITLADEYLCRNVKERQANYCVFGLEKGKHKVKITVLNGEYSVDGVEFC